MFVEQFVMLIFNKRDTNIILFLIHVDYIKFHNRNFHDFFFFFFWTDIKAPKVIALQTSMILCVENAIFT